MIKEQAATLPCPNYIMEGSSGLSTGCISNEPARWYVLRCKPHQERLAFSNLGRLGIATFFPELKESKVIRRRKQICVSALFPGYMFAKFSVEHHYRTVMYCRGVRGIVSFGSTPAVVDEEMIGGIKDRLCNGYITISPFSSFMPGRVVRIQDGPLCGIEAVFEKQLPGYQRAVLLLRAISFQARLVVDLQDIVNL